MKPINLKIKGLNSFIESQTIDFDKLTDRGFFGIFGPTGSGKSTVLDGITLALYGELARKSSNYINTNCNEASVSFEFQISGVETKRYIVDRQFKRDSKSGNPRTSGAKLTDITGEKEVIASGVNPVTKACREIIGLSLDDFTRTVVLPQGKFSEFLKLEGKQRRDMLERLFNLQQYGDNLSSKLSFTISKERSENQYLLGQLETFEDISEEVLENKNKEYEEFKLKLDKLNNELKDVLKNFEESKEIWNLQIELEQYKKEQNILDERKEEINKDLVKITLGESANKIIPYIEAYEKIVSEIKVCEEHIESLKTSIEQTKLLKEDIELQYKNISEKKDNKLPKLLKQQERIETSIEEKKNLEILIKEIEGIKLKISQVEDRIKNGEVFLKEKEDILSKATEILKKYQNKYDELKIDEYLKVKINEGILESQIYEDLLKQINRDKSKMEELEREDKKLEAEGEVLNKNLKEKDNLLNNNMENLENLVKNCPGTQENLLELQSKLSTSKEKWDKFNNLHSDIKKSKQVIKELDIELSKYTKDKEILVKSLENLKQKQDKINIEIIAQELRRGLKYEEACPVCGSIEHSLEHIELVKIEDISSEIRAKELALKDIEQMITKNETIVKSEEENVNKNSIEIENLGTEFKCVTIEKLKEEFNNLKIDIDKYSIEKDDLENKVKNLKEQKINIENKAINISTIIQRNKAQIEENKKDLIIKEKQLMETSSRLEDLRSETKVENFREKNKEIINIEKERDTLEKSIKEYREEIEKNTKDKEKALEKLNELKASLVRGNTLLSEKELNIDKIVDLIKEKVGTLDNLDNLLKEVNNEIINIQLSFDKISKNKDEIYKVEKEQNDRYIAIITKNKELNTRSINEKNTLDKIMKEENFGNEEDVRVNLISKRDINILKSKVEEYKENVAKIVGAIESSLKRLNFREINEEKWIQVNELKNNKEKEIKKVTEEKISLDNELKNIKYKLKELEGLLDKKKKLDEKLGILSDLEKLFKGKKFVEFVATSQLKYISIEASKRLKEITAGNYGLEVNEDGKFIIRDYKNGGAQRDASTLSGGETFLTSLALALALSAQIQLKGTAPLELFFLDEGFGTLDDNLLEVVMSSLERIHNDKLKVGIISHVESIKNRVPVKLILTPAKSGEGGSKVKIERS